MVYANQALARKVNGNWYYYLYNAHGDVIGLTDSQGNIVNSYEYDAWGNVLNQTETIDNPLKYAGQYYDEELQMYYLRARYYDPSIGRFTSIDAVEGSITQPLDMNQYVYCRNNPILYFDYTGKNAVRTVSGWMPDLTNVDGPYPLADFVAFVLLAGAVVIDGASYGIDRIGQSWEAYKTSVELKHQQIVIQYNEAKENGTKAKNHDTKKDNKKGTKSLPKEGEPNSSQDLLNPDGTVKQRRYYTALKNAMLRSGDTLIIKSLDRLSRNKEDIKNELQYFKENNIRIKVLDLPTTMMDLRKGQEWVFDMVNNILIEVLGTIAEQERINIRQRQREGIDAAKAKVKHLGRPKFKKPDNWDSVVSQYKQGKITAKEAIDILGVKKSTFYIQSKK